MSNFEGDPKLFLEKAGAELLYRDGQPIMDTGLENNALISLFTEPGWVGNIFLEGDQEIGSDFEGQSKGTLTLSKLANIENSARRALSSDIQKITEDIVEITNDIGSELTMLSRLAPPGNDVNLLLVSKNGLNWRQQALDPAHRK